MLIHYWGLWGCGGEVCYESEAACAVKFLVVLKVKFYFRKIKDRFLAFTFAVAKISSCVSRISSAKWISLAFMRISLHASALVGYSGERYKDKILNAPSFRPNEVRGEISCYH